MGRIGAEELDIFVEDDVAEAILSVALPRNIRQRTIIRKIGSHSSIVRVMAARYMTSARSCVCLLDGDQRGNNVAALGKIADCCDGAFTAQRPMVINWATDRVRYLPGDKWPEHWIFTSAIGLLKSILPTSLDSLIGVWGMADRADLLTRLRLALAEGKHREFHSLSNSIGLSIEDARRDLLVALKASLPTTFDGIAKEVDDLLQ